MSRSATARSRRAKSSGRFMHHPSFNGGPVQDSTIQMGPVAKFLFGDYDDVDGNSERTNQVPQSNHLSPLTGESALDDEQIQIRVVSRVAPGVGTEEDDLDRIRGVHEDSDGLRDRFFRDHDAPIYRQPLEAATGAVPDDSHRFAANMKEKISLAAIVSATSSYACVA